ncbi:hypothetical protein CXG81DRAFT_25901 [Caulochytrium protostelioides]|uniref:separase n=1 Tax=Caulochytrium protostelioides TaxID=1555241 RepID=A0A4P9X815_9FUNG|nr:hypothetical protein CXG81DRAFT_25901 [Caulochytrium protostelioides]|eukprot:RKP01407.1 hypothetical protein CXG81DRAFT_25901 [Caulochytrium protostelioides]
MRAAGAAPVAATARGSGRSASLRRTAANATAAAAAATATAAAPRSRSAAAGHRGTTASPSHTDAALAAADAEISLATAFKAWGDALLRHYGEPPTADAADAAPSSPRSPLNMQLRTLLAPLLGAQRIHLNMTHLYGLAPSVCAASAHIKTTAALAASTGAAQQRRADRARGMKQAARFAVRLLIDLIQLLGRIVQKTRQAHQSPTIMPARSASDLTSPAPALASSSIAGSTPAPSPPPSKKDTLLPNGYADVMGLVDAAMLCLCGLAFVQSEPGMQSLDLDKYTCNLTIRLLDLSEDVLGSSAAHNVPATSPSGAPSSSASSRSTSSLAHRLETSSIAKIDLLLGLLATLLPTPSTGPSMPIRLSRTITVRDPRAVLLARPTAPADLSAWSQSTAFCYATCVLRWLLLQWHARPRDLLPAIQRYLAHPDHGLYHLRLPGASDDRVCAATAEMVMRHLHRHMRWAAVHDAAQAVAVLEMYRLAIPCIPLGTYARSVAAVGMQYTKHIGEIHARSVPQAPSALSPAEAMPLLTFYEAALAHVTAVSSAPRLEWYSFIDQAMALCDRFGDMERCRRIGHLYLEALERLPRSPRTVLARIDILVTLQLTACMRDVDAKDPPDRVSEMTRLVTRHLDALCQQEPAHAEERARASAYVCEVANVQARLCQRLLSAVAVLSHRPVSGTPVEALDRLGHVARTAVRWCHATWPLLAGFEPPPVDAEREAMEAAMARLISGLIEADLVLALHRSIRRPDADALGWLDHALRLFRAAQLAAPQASGGRRFAIKTKRDLGQTFRAALAGHVAYALEPERRDTHLRDALTAWYLLESMDTAPRAVVGWAEATADVQRTAVLGDHLLRDHTQRTARRASAAMLRNGAQALQLWQTHSLPRVLTLLAIVAQHGEATDLAGRSSLLDVVLSYEKRLIESQRLIGQVDSMEDVLAQGVIYIRPAEALCPLSVGETLGLRLLETFAFDLSRLPACSLPLLLVERELAWWMAAPGAVAPWMPAATEALMARFRAILSRASSSSSLSPPPPALSSPEHWEHIVKVVELYDKVLSLTASPQDEAARYLTDTMATLREALEAQREAPSLLPVWLNEMLDTILAAHALRRQLAQLSELAIMEQAEALQHPLDACFATTDPASLALLPMLAWSLETLVVDLYLVLMPSLPALQRLVSAACTARMRCHPDVASHPDAPMLLVRALAAPTTSSDPALGLAFLRDAGNDEHDDDEDTLEADQANPFVVSSASSASSVSSVSSLPVATSGVLFKLTAVRSRIAHQTTAAPTLHPKGRNVATQSLAEALVDLTDRVVTLDRRLMGPDAGSPSALPLEDVAQCRGIIDACARVETAWQQAPAAVREAQWAHVAGSSFLCATDWRSWLQLLSLLALVLHLQTLRHVAFTPAAAAATASDRSCVGMQRMGRVLARIQAAFRRLESFTWQRDFVTSWSLHVYLRFALDGIHFFAQQGFLLEVEYLFQQAHRLLGVWETTLAPVAACPTSWRSARIRLLAEEARWKGMRSKPDEAWLRWREAWTLFRQMHRPPSDRSEVSRSPSSSSSSSSVSPSRSAAVSASASADKDPAAKTTTATMTTNDEADPDDFAPWHLHHPLAFLLHDVGALLSDTADAAAALTDRQARLQRLWTALETTLSDLQLRHEQATRRAATTPRRTRTTRAPLTLTRTKRSAPLSPQALDRVYAGLSSATAPSPPATVPLSDAAHRRLLAQYVLVAWRHAVALGHVAIAERCVAQLSSTPLDAVALGGADNAAYSHLLARTTRVRLEQNRELSRRRAATAPRTGHDAMDGVLDDGVLMLPARPLDAPPRAPSPPDRRRPTALAAYRNAYLRDLASLLPMETAALADAMIGRPPADVLALAYACMGTCLVLGQGRPMPLPPVIRDFEAAKGLMWTRQMLQRSAVAALEPPRHASPASSYRPAALTDGGGDTVAVDKDAVNTATAPSDDDDATPCIVVSLSLDTASHHLIVARYTQADLELDTARPVHLDNGDRADDHDHEMDHSDVSSDQSHADAHVDHARKTRLWSLRLPLHRHTERRPGCQTAEAVLTLDQYASEFSAIMAANGASTQLAGLDATGAGAEQATAEQKQVWWNERRRLDAALQSLLERIERAWLGGFTGIFAPLAAMPPDLMAQGHSMLTDVVERHWLSATSSAATPAAAPPVSRIAFSDMFLQYMLAQPAPWPDALTQDVLAVIVDHVVLAGYPADAVASWDALGADVRRVVHTIQHCHHTRTRSTPPRGDPHVVLILDRLLHRIPWESLPCLRRRSVSRCLSLAHYRECRQRLGAPLRDAAWLSRRDALQYVVNPGGDLVKTQRTFEHVFATMRPQPWQGIAGRIPTAAQWTATLESAGVFLYCGHGGGEQYLPTHRMRRLRRLPPVCLLMGCSSGALVDVGAALDPIGVVREYALGGSVAVVANLWDVTDRDIDRYCIALMTYGGLIDPPAQRQPLPLGVAVCQARQSCHLGYLVGAAPVLYGLPLTLTRSVDSVRS